MPDQAPDKATVLKAIKSLESPKTKAQLATEMLNDRAVRSALAEKMAAGISATQIARALKEEGLKVSAADVRAAAGIPAPEKAMKATAANKA